MKKNTKKFNHIFIVVALIMFLVLCSTNIFAQEIFGLSYGYEYFPSMQLTNPIAGAPDLKIQAQAWSVRAAFPLAFSNGKIMVRNYINYKRTDFTYQNHPENNEKIEQIQSVDYTFFMIDSLSQKWKMVVIVTPGLASDFEADVSSEDFIFAGVFGFIKQMSKNFQLGFGISYMPDFGEPIPLPFLYIDWRIRPKLVANGILPTNLNLFYNVNRNVDLGLALMVNGNRYHGDPAKFNVDKPFLKYSEGTLSPMAQIHLSKWLHLQVEGGFAFYRNFEFFDDKDKLQSLDLKKTGYVRARFVLGI